MAAGDVAELLVRFGLPGALTDRLRSGNMFYNRGQHGEYFQLYCPTYGDGFIFEIVERRGPLSRPRRAERLVPDSGPEAEAHGRQRVRAVKIEADPVDFSAQAY
jgi:hypothetical protein